MSGTITINLDSHTVPSDTVRYTITITSEGTTFECERRSPEQLKRSGISMRNIAGEFIRADAQKGQPS